MAIVVKPSNLVPNTHQSLTLNRADLLSLLSAYPQFDTPSELKKVILKYTSSASNQIVRIIYNINEDNVVKTFITDSHFIGDMNIDTLTVIDTNGGILTFNRDQLSTSEFDIPAVAGGSTGSSGSSGPELISNNNFNTGDLTDWSAVGNIPLGSLPTVHTFSPSSGLYGQTAPAGANNYYVQGAGHAGSVLNLSSMSDSKYNQSYSLLDGVLGRIGNDGVFTSNSTHNVYTYDAGGGTWYYVISNYNSSEWQALTSSLDPATLSSGDDLAPTDAEDIGVNSELEYAKYRPWSGYSTVTYSYTAESSISQEVVATSEETFTLSAKLGGTFSDDGAYVEAVFKTSADVELPISNNYSLVAGSNSDSTKNGTFIKTDVRGALEYDNGVKWRVTGNELYPVYKLTDDVLILKDITFGGDRWVFVYASGWTIDDLAHNYSVSNYSASLISMNDDFSHPGDTLKYPSLDISSGTYRYSDHYLIGLNADLRFSLNGGNFDSAFYDVSINGTTPATAAKADIKVTFVEESNGNCYAFAESVSYKE